MKYLPVFVLFLWVISFNTHAQDITVFDPIQKDNRYTPYQLNVSSGYQFLLQDELTKVLFNPAYLSEINGSHVYGTLEPGSNRNLRLAYMKDDWIVHGSFYSVYNYDEFDDFRIDESFDINYNGIFREETDQRAVLSTSRETTNDAYTGEIRFAKLLSQSDESSRAIGFYLAYGRDSNERDRINSRTTDVERMVFRNDTLTEVYTSDEEDLNINTQENTNRKYYAAIDYSFLNESTQGYHRVFFQYAKREVLNGVFDTNDDDTQTEDIENGFSSTYITRRDRESVNREELSPILFGYEGYFNKEINWLGSDYFFTSLRASFSPADPGITFTDRYVITTINNGSSSENVIRDYELTDSENSSFQARGSLTLGYAIELNYEDLKFFTGFSQSVGYIKTNSRFMDNNNGVMELDRGDIQLTSRVPVFAEYSLNEWISVFGGGSLIVNNQFNTTEYSIDTPLEDISVNDFNQKYNSFTESTSNNTFFGVKVVHPEGLQLMADINGDIARLGGWRITVGYSF
jgi:hypothetical protein